MKNLKIRKKMLALAIFNMVLFATKSNTYAKNDILIEQTKDIMDNVLAKEDVAIKEKPTKFADIIGILKEGNTLKLLMHIDGYYEVLYNGEIAYVRDNVVEEVENNSTYAYLTNDSTLFNNSNLCIRQDDIKKYQFVDILKVLNDAYLVEINGKIGYVSKKDIERLTGKYMVVDISDQMVRMYDNNQIILESPVVTGQPPYNATPEGIFKISYIGDHYNLKKNPKYYVDHMMAFNGNIGFHDAEYHTDDSGHSYGWRDLSEFGGYTYLTNGSHGCVNMPHYASELMRENVEIGQKVLVKE